MFTENHGRDLHRDQMQSRVGNDRTRGLDHRDGVTIPEPTSLPGACPLRFVLNSTLLVPSFHPVTHQHGRVFLVASPGLMDHQVDHDAAAMQQREESAPVRPSWYPSHLWNHDNLRADIHSCTGIEQSTRA